MKQMAFHEQRLYQCRRRRHAGSHAPPRQRLSSTRRCSASAVAEPGVWRFSVCLVNPAATKQTFYVARFSCDGEFFGFAQSGHHGSFRPLAGLLPRFAVQSRSHLHDHASRAVASHRAPFYLSSGCSPRDFLIRRHSSGVIITIARRSSRARARTTHHVRRVCPPLGHRSQQPTVFRAVC